MYTVRESEKHNRDVKKVMKDYRELREIQWRNNQQISILSSGINGINEGIMRSEQGRSKDRVRVSLGKFHGPKNKIVSSISRRMRFEKNLGGGGIGKDKYHYDEFFRMGFMKTKKLEMGAAKDLG